MIDLPRPEVVVEFFQGAEFSGGNQGVSLGLETPVDILEELLYLPTTLRHSRPGVDQVETQFPGDSFEVRTRVDGSVVAIQTAGNPELQDGLLETVFKFGTPLLEVVLRVDNVPGVIVYEGDQVGLAVLALVFGVGQVKRVVAVSLPCVIPVRRLETAVALDGVRRFSPPAPNAVAMCSLELALSASPAISSMVMI